MDDFDKMKAQKDALSWAALRSDRALVAHNEKVTEAGAREVWYVVMKDGYMLDCGSGPKGEKRAEAVATKLNA